jgi:hypothetical protein
MQGEEVTVDSAKEILLERVDAELTMAQQCASQYIVIGNHSAQINKSTYRHAFYYIQQNALSSLVLSLGKLYEPYNGRYQNYSIPTAITLLQAALGQFSVVSGAPYPLNRYLVEQGVTPPTDQNDATAVVSLVLQHFGEVCPSAKRVPPTELDRNYIALRVLRDKRIAHHENHDLANLESTSLEELKKLIAFGYSARNVLGYTMFGFTPKMGVSESEVNYETTVVATELKAMISKLGI